MFGFGKKKKKEEEEDIEPEDPGDQPDPTEDNVPVASAPSQPAGGGGDVSTIKISADVEKLKAQFSTFYELQKTTGERFTRVNEQIGELRTMLIERDKDAQHIEAKATQAVDLVKTVQPDKLMVEIRKQDGKTEALKANIESNESIVKNMINEIKDIKEKINIFRGMEQVIKLNEEAKKELFDTKKIKAVVERHADKVETIFSEMQKKIKDIVKLEDTIKDLDKSFKQISSEFDSIKVKVNDLASKKEVEKLISKVEDFEKYTGNIINLINNRFEKLEKEVTVTLKQKFEDVDRLLTGFQVLAEKTPDLDKYFHLLEEEANKKPATQETPEKLKEAGAEPEKPKVEEKESVLDKVKEALKFGKA